MSTNSTIATRAPAGGFNAEESCTWVGFCARRDGAMKNARKSATVRAKAIRFKVCLLDRWLRYVVFYAASRWLAQATGKRLRASVQNMKRNTQRHWPVGRSSGTAGRFVLLGLLLPCLLVSFHPAAMAQSIGAGAPAAIAAPATPSLAESLRPALDQVSSALNQVQIDHWKLSREWKAQLRGDADSIQQDLSSRLPALLQASQQAPAALGPRLGVLHNVNALYDVLLRVTTAGNLAAGKNDAAILENARQQLESARKSAAAQLLQMASEQDRQIAIIQSAQAADLPANSHPKTIVVDNSDSHRSRHRKSSAHRKPSPATPITNSPSGTKPPS